MLMSPNIREESLLAFKNNTKENEQVVRILRDELLNDLDERILDVGAGVGDIALGSFPNHEATLIDRLDFSTQPIAPKHARIQADFFDVYVEFENFHGTVIYSHVLQYLDDRYDELIKATCCINPNTIITVTNCNDGIMGKLVNWSQENIPQSNPEVVLLEFPECCGYTEIQSRQFTAHASDVSYSNLAALAAYLIDAPANGYLAIIEDFLRRSLTNPCFEIAQSVKVYKRVKMK